MSMQDPVADMLTRIRNGQQAKHLSVVMSSSLFKEHIARVLKDEGYISDYSVRDLENKSKELTIELKYYKGQPVILKIRRISKPGLRIYKSVSDLKPVPGFGITILSTSQGVMSHVSAKAKRLGGEVICEVA